MRKLVIYPLLLCMGLGMLALLPNQAKAEKPDITPVGRKIVSFAPGMDMAAQIALLHAAGVQKIKPLPLVNAVAIEASELTAQALRGQPDVTRVSDDALVYATGKPVRPTPGEALPWGIDRVDAERVWDVDANFVIDTGAVTGSNVRVAVVDTGIDLDHPELAANIKGGYNAIDPAVSYDDDNGHGTHVAGIIAAIDNTAGILGVAPQASLYAVKVLDANGSGWVSDIIEALQWCVNNQIQVVNMSLSASVDVPEFQQAIQAAANAGIVLVAAAGNTGNQTAQYPASYPEVIAVSATMKRKDSLANFSTYGPQVDIAAPGDSIYSTYFGGKYATMSGTSMAAPHVAGVAALVCAAGVTDGNGNGRVNDEVQDILQATAEDKGAAGVDIYYGYGIVQADAAVAATR